jgi:hypothetical protein
MKTITTYSAFNERRYSNPWVALVDKNTAKIDFSQKIGGYTGKYNGGEAGELFVINPIENAVYAYGQKDYRQPKNTEVNYCVFKSGIFIDIEKTELIQYLQA